MTTTVKRCGYCPKPAEALYGDPALRRAGRGPDHTDCYLQMLQDLDAAEVQVLAEREAARLAQLDSGELHVDDEEFLAGLSWSRPRSHPCCSRCHGEHPTVCVGVADDHNGPGVDVRYCRACIGVQLTIARFQAEDHGRVHVVRLPRVA